MKRKKSITKIICISILILIILLLCSCKTNIKKKVDFDKLSLDKIKAEMIGKNNNIKSYVINMTWEVEFSDNEEKNIDNFYQIVLNKIMKKSIFSCKDGSVIYKDDGQLYNLNRGGVWEEINNSYWLYDNQMDIMIDLLSKNDIGVYKEVKNISGREYSLVELDIEPKDFVEIMTSRDHLLFADIAELDADYEKVLKKGEVTFLIDRETFAVMNHTISIELLFDSSNTKNVDKDFEKEITYFFNVLTIALDKPWKIEDIKKDRESNPAFNEKCELGPSVDCTGYIGYDDDNRISLYVKNTGELIMYDTSISIDRCRNTSEKKTLITGSTGNFVLYCNNFGKGTYESDMTLNYSTKVKDILIPHSWDSNLILYIE